MSESGWWNITTTRGRYAVKAADEYCAEDEVAEDLEPGEVILDGMNAGPFASQAEAEDA